MSSLQRGCEVEREAGRKRGEERGEGGGGELEIGGREGGRVGEGEGEREMGVCACSSEHGVAWEQAGALGHGQVCLRMHWLVSMHTHVRACVCVCVCVCMCVCTCIGMCVCMHVYVPVCMPACVSTSMSVRVCLCTCVHAHVRMRMHHASLKPAGGSDIRALQSPGPPQPLACGFFCTFRKGTR